MKALFKSPARFLIAVFILQLIFSYAGIAWVYKTAFLFGEVTHEDGEQTFLGSMLNLSHFLREVPIAILMCLGSVGGFLFLGTKNREPVFRKPGVGKIRILWIVTATVPILAIFLCTIENGPLSVWYELAQYKTRGDTLVYGSHWYNHLLHSLFIPFECLVICSFFRIVREEVRGDCPSAGSRYLFAWLVLFFCLSAVLGFRIVWAMDPLYLAHQLREIGTHGTLSVPLILGLCFYLESKSSAGNSTESKPSQKSFIPILLLSLLITLIIPLYIVLALRNVEILELAQKEAGYLELFFSHNFEHLIDYVFMGLLGSALYLTAIK